VKIPAEFDSLKAIRKIFAGAGRTVGVGVSAFQRSGLGYILPNYEILSLLETSDLGAIRKICPVTVIPGPRPEKFNTLSILSLNWVRSWLGTRNFRRAHTCRERREVARAKICVPAPFINLFVYKAAAALDSVIKTLPVRLLSSPGHIREPLEDKKQFRLEAAKAGIQIPAGVNLTLADLTLAKWDQLKLRLGQRLVFQLTDISAGGGQGTFFIDSRQDWKRFWEFVESQQRKKGLYFVNVCRRIAGQAASITGCATRYGVITGVLQTQIMDQPELAGFAGRNGVWLGHDWTVRFSETAQINAEILCQKWGEYIYRQGYKGIFGLDVVVGKDDQVTAIECNSRYTGAFPVYTMLQLSQGETPLDVWHLAEWLGLDYETDIDAVRQVNRRPKIGAHVILHSLADKPVPAGGAVKAGVYKISRQPYVPATDSLALPASANYLHTRNVRPPKAAPSRTSLRKLAGNRLTVKFVRPGFSLLDIKSNDEFVLCDRVPEPGQVVKPGEWIGKLIFKRRIIDNSGRLLPEIRAVIKGLYRSFALRPIR
jgi:hypothetical protein